MIRAIGLVRVSKKTQAAEDRFSIPAQVKAITEYCERNGIELVDVYEEPGTSAFVQDVRKIPKLALALERIEAGDANALIVHESSRLARTERLLAEIADRLQACGADLINSSMGGFKYFTPEGRLILANEGSLNTYWSRKVSEHSRKGKREQFEQGLHIGQIPFGYAAAVIERDGQLVTTRSLPMVVVPEEAEAIRKAYADFALGKNAHAIAREWDERGFKPRSAKGIEYFQPQTVRGILQNRLYTGVVCHKGEWRPGKHEPIISDDLFWSAQRPKQIMRRTKYPPLLLIGLATCVEGHRLYSIHAANSRKRDDPRRHPYYIEPSPNQGRPCSQGGRLRRAGDPDRRVEKVLLTLGLDEEWLRYVDQQARIGRPVDPVRERERIEAKLARLQDEYIEGRLTKEKWDRRFGDCQRELAALNVPDEPVQAVHGTLQSWLQLWEAASPEAKNKTARLVFDQIVIDFDTHEVTLVPNPEFQPLFEARRVYVRQTQPVPG